MEKVLPILLSAGMGTRLSNDSNKIPKSLIKLHGKPLIFFQLDKLQEIGCEEVLIVVGYQAKKLQSAVGDIYQNMKITYVFNEEYESSGTALSFYKARDSWQKIGGAVLMLHGDIFYDTTILNQLLKNLNTNILITDYGYENLTNDEMVVFANEQSVLKVVKGPLDLQNSIGESLGINFFTNEFCQAYFAYLAKFLMDVKNKKFHWEQTIEGFLDSHDYLQLSHLGIDSKQWININYPGDLDYAVKNIYSKLYNKNLDLTKP
jgi:L-glutamine-phosphate cytidylyltransferase